MKYKGGDGPQGLGEQSDSHAQLDVRPTRDLTRQVSAASILASVSSLITGGCQVEQPQWCYHVDSDFEQQNSRLTSGRRFTLGLLMSLH